MGTKIIGQLPAVVTPAVADKVPIEQSGIAKYATLEDILELLGTPAGTISAFGGAAAPDGWLLCDGSAVSRSTYARLFTAISTTWGVGDGATTFNVPDLRGAFLRGTGSHGTANMADGNDFAGPAVGAFENDQIQGHWHQLYRASDNIGLGGSNVSAGAGTASVVQVAKDTNTTSFHARDPFSDGTNGTPRTGDETRPFAAGITYIIKT